MNPGWPHEMDKSDARGANTPSVFFGSSNDRANAHFYWATVYVRFHFGRSECTAYMKISGDSAAVSL